MKVCFRNLSVALVLSVIVGCSSNPASLDRTQLSQNKITEVTLVSPEKLNYEPSTAGVQSAAGFGFIGGITGSLIDSGINSNRQKSMQPILKTLGNYSIKNSLNAKLKRLSGNSFKPNLAVINAETSPKTPKLNSLGVKSNSVLAANHQSVTINAGIKLKTSEEGKVYTRNFTSNTKIPLNLKGNERINVTEYLINNPLVLRNTIETTLDKIVGQISNDINIGPKS